MARSGGTRTQRKTEPAQARAKAWWNVAGPLGLFVLICLVYLPSISNDFIYDDTQVILSQGPPQSLSDIVRIFGERHFPRLPYYRPITRTSLLLQKSLHGENPAPFHVFNAVLMGVAGLLAYSLLTLPVLGIHPLPALIAATLFCLHPVASSCVYPISSGRETLLPSVFTLLSVYAYLRGGIRWHCMALLGFVGALLSKEQAVVIPLLFLLADTLKLAPDAPRTSVRDWIARYWIFALVLVAYFLIRHFLFGGAQYLPGNLLGPLLSTLYTLQTIVVPFKELVYEPTVPVWFSLPRLAIAASVVILLIFLLQRHRATLGRQTAFWAGWFVITLLPTANLLRQEAAFDERYAFLTSLSFFAATSLLASAHWRQREVRSSVMVGGAVLAGFCAFVTLGRCEAFKDDIHFSQQWLRSNPAIGGSSEGDRPRLSQVFHSVWFDTTAPSVNAHYNLGFALAKKGQFEASITHYSEALRLNPDYAYAHNNLANALVAVGRQGEALPHFSRAIQIKPDYVDARFNYGLSLAQLGRLEEARVQFQEALNRPADSSDAQQQVDYAALHNSLGNVVAQQGELAEAVAQYSQALRLRPDYADAHNNLANILAGQSKFEEAVQHYSAALRVRPDYADARHNLHIVLNRLREAREPAEP